MKKFALYTARFGVPDRFNIPGISIPDVDRFCFTDLDVQSGCHQMFPLKKRRYFKNDFYDVVKMKLDHISPIPTRRQRFVKICIPDEIFNNYEYSVYVDCKRRSVIDFEWLLSFMKPGSDFVTRQHKARDCAYDEGKVCIEKRKDGEAIILKQLDFYRREGFPTHNGLHYSYILLRRHTEKMKWFSQFWWQQLERYSFRDQISLPYVAWKHGEVISICPRSR